MLENNSDRKIAVIFATDVVGYSKSIEDNENETLINLKECREILDQLLMKYPRLKKLLSFRTEIKKY